MRPDRDDCRPPFRRYGPAPWMRRQRWQHHGPPRFVRAIGCAFAALIVVAAVSSSALVALFAHLSSTSRLVAAGLAIAVVVAIIAGFVVTIGRTTRFFREQDRLRRQLMADVAHELRTPLSVLQGRVEGMLDGVYPRDDETLSRLLAETRHLSRLVDDVRTLANAEAGALDLQKERVDLAELIREAAGAMASPVAVKIPEGLPPVMADPVRIREVLLNLLTNAEAAGGNVSVLAVDRERTIEIRVHDDGPGIPADELPHVFERFHKGGSSRGTGLGLSIAQRIVIAHGGRIDIESAPGAGTTVVFFLPV